MYDSYPNNCFFLDYCLFEEDKVIVSLQNALELVKENSEFLKKNDHSIVRQIRIYGPPKDKQFFMTAMLMLSDLIEVMICAD